MRKLLFTLSVILGLGLSSSIFAQGTDNYCVWDEATKPRKKIADNWGQTVAERIVQSLAVIETTAGGEQNSFTIPVAGVGQTQPVTKIFFDRTSQTIQLKQGSTIAVNPAIYKLEWMHFYLYIDFNHDGQFNQTDELVSFTHIRDAAGVFHDSKGTRLPNGNIYNNGKLPTFTIPTTATTGPTRARFKCDWNSKDPCGANDLHTNRGAMCDFTIDIQSNTPPAEETVNFTLNVSGEGGTATLYDKATDSRVENLASIKKGAALQLRTLPDDTYEVSELKVNDVDRKSELSNNILELTADADTRISVSFAKKTYPISISKTPAEGGEVNITKVGGANFLTENDRIEHGSMVTIIPTPAAGYKLTKFMVNGQQALTQFLLMGEVQLEITRPLVVEVEYTASKVKLEFEFNAEEGDVKITKEDDITEVASGSMVGEGTMLHIHAQPKSGYELASISLKNNPEVDLIKTELNEIETNVYEMAIENDRYLVIKFKQKTSVNDITTLNYQVSSAKGYVLVDGVEAGTQVELYDMAGLSIVKAIAQDSSVKLAANKGVYVIKIGNAVTKVAVE